MRGSGRLFLVLTVAAVAGLAAGPEGAKPTQRNLVLIVVDTLRATHLSCYGYDRPTSPNIDRLAARGVRFARCYSPARWTLPAIASILTSIHPRAHQAVRPGAVLPERFRTLAEVLGDRGYRTQAIVSGYFAEAKHGLGQGFQGYDATHSIGRNGVTSVGVTDDAVAWLAERRKDAPFFLMAHYYEPHYNYMYHDDHSYCGWGRGEIYSNIRIEEIRKRHRRMSPDDFDTLLGLYDGEIHLMDQEVGRLLAAIEELSLGPETLIVFTADHGEEFAEHAPHFGHNGTMCHHVLQVPWIMAGLDGELLERRVRDDPVSTLDILPTVLPLLGVELEGFVHGVDVLARGHGRDRVVVSSARNGDATIHAGPWSLQVGRQKRLYDLRTDPLERRDLSRQRPGVVFGLTTRLQEELDRLSQLEAPAEEMELTAEELEKIRSLGYAE